MNFVASVFITVQIKLECCWWEKKSASGSQLEGTQWEEKEYRYSNKHKVTSLLFWINVGVQMDYRRTWPSNWAKSHITDLPLFPLIQRRDKKIEAFTPLVIIWLPGECAGRISSPRSPGRLLSRAFIVSVLETLIYLTFGCWRWFIFSGLFSLSQALERGNGESRTWESSPLGPGDSKRGVRASILPGSFLETYTLRSLLRPPEPEFTF